MAMRLSYTKYLLFVAAGHVNRSIVECVALVLVDADVETNIYSPQTIDERITIVC